MPAKVLKIFFAQSLKMIAMRNFQKEVIFPSFLSFKIYKKKLHLGTRNADVNTLPENSCQNSQNRLLEFRNWWKIWALSHQSCFSPKRSSNKHNEILASLAWLCCQKTKNFPELQKCWSYNFLNKFFFIKNDSLAMENAILTTVAKNFSLRVHTFAAQIPKTTKKSGIFWNDNKIPQNVPMYM